MMLVNFTLRKWLLILIVVLTVAACGGSSSNDPVSESVSGYVADGYLSGATVFLDCNNNRIQDADEISSTTDGTGRYVLDTTGAASVEEISSAS